MQDGLGREIDYLRISVTDKCNLRCRYCMPPQGITPLAHEEILTLEEIFRLVGIMEQLGIRKVRLTGGEPMVRKNLPLLVEQIHGLCGIREIAMTTNGTLFAPQAEVYRKAGLTAVNISLDTLDPERFRCITGCDRADRAAGVDSVLRAIDAALEQQLRVKINCVPCVEMNGEDMEGIAALAADRPVDVRFIELMPIGCGKDYTGISSEEILRRLERRFGAARYFATPFKGTEYLKRAKVQQILAKKRTARQNIISFRDFPAGSDSSVRFPTSSAGNVTESA